MSKTKANKKNSVAAHVVGQGLGGAKAVYRNDAEYDAFVGKVSSDFCKITEVASQLFTVESDDLFDIYLSGIDEAVRKNHVCNDCRRFFKNFGGIVIVDPETGSLTSPVWNENSAIEEVKAAIAKVRKAVESRKVIGTFFYDKTALGNARSGAFSHFHAVLKTKHLWINRKLNCSQKSAEKLEDFKTLRSALGEIRVEVLRDAKRVLEAGALDRSEKFVNHVAWLIELKEKKLKGDLMANWVWLKSATAPDGWCHVKSSMIGTLIEDLSAKISFDSVKKRWSEKVDPLKYQRPQAMPKNGTIAAAEKLFEKLNLEASLERRFAKIEEIQHVWRPTVKIAPKKDGIFSDLKTNRSDKKHSPLEVDAGRMTWVKFVSKILPGSDKLEVFVDDHRNDFVALVTAVHPEAEPIFQWDLKESRNPVSWYRYSSGSLAKQWNLTQYSWINVKAISDLPDRWFGRESGNVGVVLVLEGAKDLQSSGSAIFPETLKSDLHEVRSVIEAHSSRSSLSGIEEASACGLGISQAMIGLVKIRSTDANGAMTICQIDRFD